MSIFTAKNEDRKLGRTVATTHKNGVSRFHEARQLRRRTSGEGSTPGAFGNLKPGHFNDRVFGTTGIAKDLGKDDEEDGEV